MLPTDIKMKFFKSGKFQVSPESIDRLLKSRAVIFHFLTFLWHTLLNYQTLAGAIYILFNRTDLVKKTCGFGIQYVTIWNLVIEQNYFNVCLLQDVLEKIPDPKYDRIRSRLRTALPFAFSSIVFPLSILVTLNFWGIYSHHPHVIDEDNVTESFFPPWVNHGLHTTNVLLVFAELFVARRTPPGRLLGCLCLFSVLAAYCATCTLLYYVGGVWPYPLIGMLTVWQRLLYVAANFALGYLIMAAGRILHDKIWGQKAIPAAKDAKKYT